MAKWKNKTNEPETKPADKNKFPPNLYLAENGRSWIIDFTYKGVRYKENLGPVSKTIAKEVAARRKAAAAEGRLETGPKIEDLLFENICDKYLEWCQAHLRPRSYERCVTSSVALKAYWGGTRLSKISAFGIEAYKLDRKTVCTCLNRAKAERQSQRCPECKHLLNAKANGTINRELAMLKSLFYKAVEWKFVKETPMKRVKFFSEGKGRTRFLTQEEAERLLKACNEDFRDVVLTALHSGCRKSEISSLLWSNVDLGHRSFTVQACYAKNGETKTLPMTDEVFAMFERLNTERDRKPSDLVFVSRYNKPWKSWSTAWDNACVRAGIKDFRFHDLRHCFGSWLAMNGTAPKAMMELMGHKTASMTMRYSHLSVEYKRQAVAKLPKFGNLETKGPLNPPSKESAKVVGFRKQ